MDMKEQTAIPALRDRLRPVWGALLGGLAGYMLLHPYVMFLHSVGAVPLHAAPPGSWGWSLSAFLALEYTMLPMAAPLALFGAAAGLMAGLYLNRSRKLQRVLLDQEKDSATLETVKAFTATLSHYLLNANMIIGGQVRHLRRSRGSGPDSRLDAEPLDVIEEQCRIIDATIGSLREASRVIIRNDSSARIPMIDLVRDLEERVGGGPSKSPDKEAGSADGSQS